METAQELINWLEERLEYYNYEHRYSNDEKTREIIDARRVEVQEILDNFVKN